MESGVAAVQPRVPAPLVRSRSSATHRARRARRDITPAREAVLEYVREVQRPVGVVEISQAVYLHENTARQHLEALVDAGVLRRTKLQRGRPRRGRPAFRYAEVERDPGRCAEVLDAVAQVLTDSIAADECRDDVRVHHDGAITARGAGRALGQGLIDAEAASLRGVDARREVVHVLRDLQFAPTVDARATRIRLRRCPFLDVAADHCDVVCAVHEGMIEGMLRQTGDGETSVWLLPFATTDACLLRLIPPAKASS